jgi:FlaA1/EpsC-like NDP-sugar epimerase
MDDSRIRWFIGDIRDIERLKRALHGIDYVVHAAALKQVDTGEYNPMEFIKTNVMGSQNVIDASIEAGVKRVVALSTDKASSPINLYGATKLTADKLFIAANNYSFSYGTTFSVVRYGNVMGSRGSVLETFLQQKKSGVFQITDKKMTRFNINMSEAIDFVIYCLINLKGGEIFVPKLPSFYITDLSKAVSDSCKTNIIGIRPGEKIHEEMISSYDSLNTIDLGRCFTILNQNNLKFYKDKKFLHPDFSYQSNTNNDFLNVAQLKKIIKDFI